MNASRMRLSRWAPYGLVLVAVSSGALSAFAPAPHGHWTGHVGNAAVAGVQMLLIVGSSVVLARRLGVTAVFAVAALVGLAIAVVGNLVVAGAIWATPYGDAEVGTMGGVAGIDSGHNMEGAGEEIVWVAGLLFVFAAAVLRKIPVTVAVIGILLSLIPPWIWPGIGITFVLAYLLSDRVTGWERARRAAPLPPSAPHPMT
jgi:hypothetical protein